ncbi:MAG: tRNA (guanine(46)-N(7))-methyltransferase TrmB [Myxococcota bacterium]
MTLPSDHRDGPSPASPEAVLPADPSVAAYAALAPRPPEGPVDLDALVRGEGPLDVDVGFGRGLSLFERAALAPERRLLGIEVRSKWVCRVEARRRREGLAHVRVVAADAKALLARSGPGGAVDRMFCDFPDPWWKKRHAKRRIIDDTFVAEVTRLLRPGGQFFIQTDVPERAEAYDGILRRQPGLTVERCEHNPFGARSNRERRAEADGLPVYRLLATKDPSSQ